MTRGRCYFCGRTNVQLSLEHLVSEPIAQIAGIDRARDQYADVDGRSGRIESGPAPHLAHAVHGPCIDCNSGWMSALEVAAAAAAERMRGSASSVARQDDLRSLSAWMLKTYIISGLRQAGFRNPFTDDGLLSNPVPIPRQATNLAAGRWDDALANTSLGVGAHESAWRLTAFGNPRTTPDRLKLFAGVFVFGFPRLERQLWLVNNVFDVGSIEWPFGVAPADQLEEPSGANPDPALVHVVFPITDEQALQLI